jgi:tetratricopeptide (TPR) repeat protein
MASHDHRMPTDSVSGVPDARTRLIHHETVRLVQLGILAVAAFLLTRTLASIDRDTTLRNGVEWYEHGTRLLAIGDAGRAADAFRRAVVTNRRNPRYALALADALVRQHQNEAARVTLLALRKTVPEDPQVNLRLARLATSRKDTEEAVSFYHNALYAPWRPEDENRRRKLRLELIDFLLDGGQSTRAIPELVALGTDAPDDPQLQIELAHRFARAGDSRAALGWYQRALRRSPRDVTTLAAAAEAAFALGDYRLSQQYFRGIHDKGVETDTRRVVDVIVTSDPLAVRLGASERRRRLWADIDYAERRLTQCRPAPAASADASTEELLRRARLTQRQLGSRRAPDMDTIEAGVGLIYDLLVAPRPGCIETPHDRALILLAQHYGADRR